MQTRKFSRVKDDEYDREYSEANPESDMLEPLLPDDYDEFPHLSPPDAKVSDDPTLLKRADSLWKVGAKVSMVKGVENAVANAASIGSVMHRCYQASDPLAIFVRAKSFAFYLKPPANWTSPPLTGGVYFKV